MQSFIIKNPEVCNVVKKIKYLFFLFLLISVNSYGQFFSIRYDNGIPVIDALIDGRWHTLILDTGYW